MLITLHEVSRLPVHESLVHKLRRKLLQIAMILLYEVKPELAPLYPLYEQRADHMICSPLTVLPTTD